MRMTRLFAALALVLGGPLQAQDYPAKPVRVIVPYPAGSSTDVEGRAFAKWLEERTRQPFVIENRGGAGALVGTEAVVNAAPDGYTILYTGAAFTTFKALTKDL